MTRRWWRRSVVSAGETAGRTGRPRRGPRPIGPLDLGDGLSLEAATPAWLDAFVIAGEDDVEDLYTSIPWMRSDTALQPQVADLLLEVADLGRWGGAYHWVIVEEASGRVLGLIGLDPAPRSERADWNLGYWVRRRAQRRGLAGRGTDALLTWMHTWDQELVLEVSVDPGNRAGLATCERLIRRWGGRRHPEGDGEVELDRGPVMHLCHLIDIPSPRRP